MQVKKEQWKVTNSFCTLLLLFSDDENLRTRIFILHDELLDFTKSAAELERPRNTWDECVNYVIGELNSLIESPYMKSNWTSSTEKGWLPKVLAKP